MATPQDAHEFYGGEPPYTMRAMVVTLGGAVMAIGGVAYRDGLLYAFMQIKDELRPYKVTIARFARRLTEVFGGNQGFTIAEPGEPMAEKLLQWLGFEHIGGCRDGEVYRWRG